MKKLNLDFGLYSTDLKQVIRFLKQDMNDDWFKDPLLFEDKFNEEAICSYFEKNINKNNGVYSPSSRLLMNIPKKQGTLRYSLETNFYDRIAYHAFGITLIKYFDPLLSRRVFSHRLNNSEIIKSKPRYLFYNSIVQWTKFKEYIKIDSKNATILFTDVQNYFENINIQVLKEILYRKLTQVQTSGKKKSIIRFCIDSICNCLQSWAFNSENGLPQNRDISSFLANIYMDPIDNYIINQGYDYYRYMDDIRVICKDEFEARKSLKVICHQLRNLHLSLNGSKTKILKPKTKDHNNFIMDNGIGLEKIDSMFKTKKKQIVALAFKEVKVGIEECINKNDFYSREFRFFNIH